MYAFFRNVSFLCMTSPFPIVELLNPRINEFYLVQERRAMDLKLQNCERARQVGSSSERSEQES